MVQDQLAEYIASQVRLGVSRDAVKAALVGAGWAAADVEDTLKKVESMNKPRPASSPPAAAPPSGGAPAGGVMKSGDPQSIKVSDLISASGSAVPFTSGSATSQGRSVPKKMIEGSSALVPRAAGGLILKIVGTVIILGLGGLAGFLYFQNSDLTGKIAALNAKSADVASRVASLSGQVQAQNASNTALVAGIASMTAENATLRANLSFAALPPVSSGTPSSETVSVSGALAIGKSSFTLTTPYGIAVFVQNAKDAKVAAALTPLLKSTSSVTLTGTHVPGSQYITVTAVNGSALR